MKAFITLAFICLIASAFAIDLDDSQQKAYFNDCIKQENLSEKDANNLLNKDFTNPSPALKCFGACFFEKLGTVKDGVVQNDLVLQKFAPFFGEDKVKGALDKCKDVKGNDRCDNGFKLWVCFEKAKAEF